MDTKTSVNPYDSPDSISTLKAARHGVKRHLLAATLFVCLGVCIAIPGVYLLNQQLQLIPTSTVIGGFAVDGKLISISVVIWFSLGTAGIMQLAAIGLVVVGLGNLRKNLTNAQLSAVHEG